MACYIGQFRKPQLDNYYNNNQILSENMKLGGGTNFGIPYTNRSFTISDNNNSPVTLTKGKCYYLKFTTNLTYLGNEPTRYITVKLSTQSASEVNVQILTLKNNPKVGSTPTVVETTFIPNRNYQYILFQITRTSEDDRTTNNINNSKGSLFDSITINTFVQLPNTIDILETINPNLYQNIGYFKKIGIQAPTGFQFNIEGQNIRIGNSGIYQINNGYKIKEIYFSPTQEDYFIMDFEY